MTLLRHVDTLLLTLHFLAALIGIFRDGTLSYTRPQGPNTFLGAWINVITIILILLVFGSMTRLSLLSIRSEFIRVAFSIFVLVEATVIAICSTVGGKTSGFWTLLWVFPMALYTSIALGRAPLLSRPRKTGYPDVLLPRLRHRKLGSATGHVVRTFTFVLIFMMGLQSIMYASRELLVTSASEFLPITTTSTGESRNIHIVCVGSEDSSEPTAWLLHGGGFNDAGSPGISMSSLQEELVTQREGQRTCYYDRGGFGLSDRMLDDEFPLQPTVDEDELHQILTQHPWGHSEDRQVELWGHAFGGDLALRYSVRWPDRVRFVIMIESLPVEFDYQLDGFEKDDLDGRRAHVTRTTDVLRALWPVGAGAVWDFRWRYSGADPRRLARLIGSAFVDCKYWDTRHVVNPLESNPDKTSWRDFPASVPIYVVLSIPVCPEPDNMDDACSVMRKVIIEGGEEVAGLSDHGSFVQEEAWGKLWPWTRATEIVGGALQYIGEHGQTQAEAMTKEEESNPDPGLVEERGGRGNKYEGYVPERWTEAQLRQIQLLREHASR